MNIRWPHAVRPSRESMRLLQWCTRTATFDRWRERKVRHAWIKREALQRQTMAGIDELMERVQALESATKGSTNAP